jgi:glycine cleavage system H protein
MSNSDNLNFLDDILYSRDHEWVKKTNGVAIVGITDFAQNQLGDVVYVELPAVGNVYKKGDVLASIESVKAVSEVYMPVTGVVISVNEKLKDQPELINNDPYKDGFIAEIQIENQDELKLLMNKDNYLKLLEGLD